MKSIGRPYTVKKVKESVGKAVEKSFECVNIDFMFDLPGQTGSEIEQAGHEMVDLGVDQVATYPLFNLNLLHKTINISNL